jgi:type II secretion system (T2SS) protein G
LPSNFAAWQLNTWTALRAAALVRYQEHLALVQQERDRLWMQLTGRDTLSLRRLEREELLRVIMQWLIGPDYFETAPDDIAGTIDKIHDKERLLMRSAAGPFQPLSEADWGNALLFGEFVKFVHEAIEWENLLYFMYPYFWGSDSLGRQKVLFEHPDPEHRNFLRAGYMRVIITVRPGFETDFTHLIESGSLSGVKTSPYMPIAQEVANFAHVNYANLTPANPEKHARPLLYPQQRETWEIMQKVIDLISVFHVDNGIYPADLSVLAGAPFDDAWGRPLIYRLPGAGNDYDLLSLGANGIEGGDGLNADISSAAAASLVGTWFEYTPTSGINIEIDTKPEDIA